MKKTKTNKKNLRRISVVVSAQTLWHLNRLCAMAGYNSNGIGKVIDKLVRAYCAERGGNNGNTK